MSEDIRNVFISHIHEDDDGLHGLKSLVREKGMTVRDASITKGKFNSATDPDYIKYGILSKRIDWAGTFVVYVSRETKDSDWVNWEIERAHRKGKRIVGVWERGAKDCELPEALNRYAHAVVGWNGESIVDAINGVSNGWYNPDGSNWGYRTIARHDCR